MIDWQPVSTYKEVPFAVLCCHQTKRWLRFGRKFPGYNGWYYSATNERTQYSQTIGDEPTHWAPVPELPPHLDTKPGK